MSTPVRAPTDADLADLRPLYVVWETTLACNLRCTHCGSRAGLARPNELTTEECLSVIAQLHALGTREITLIGGEAYLRRDWLTLVEAISSRDMLCGLQTGGRALTPARIAQAAQAGLKSAGISIDGMPDVHDQLRGVRGSFRSALNALRACRAEGLTGSVNTQINALNIGQLRQLMDVIIAAGCKAWQVQLTVAMGRAADRPELLLQPHDLLQLMPLLADLFVEGQRRGLRLMPGNNVGYFGPYEALWRSITGKLEYYGGCNAGRTALGIEADGTIKGCPSLPTSDYAGGNVRDTPLRELWERSARIGFTRSRADNHARLWGYCRQCVYAENCQGGCSWTSHVLSGRPGNNPYCHHRAIELDRKHLRERIVPRRPAEGKPFDYGLYEIIVEDSTGRQFDQDIFREIFAENPRSPVSPPDLSLCDACGEFFASHLPACSHCQAEAAPERDIAARRAMLSRVEAQIVDLQRHGSALENTIARMLRDNTAGQPDRPDQRRLP